MLHFLAPIGYLLIVFHIVGPLLVVFKARVAVVAVIASLGMISWLLSMLSVRCCGRTRAKVLSAKRLSDKTGGPCARGSGVGGGFVSDLAAWRAGYMVPEVRSERCSAGPLARAHDLPWLGRIAAGARSGSGSFAEPGRALRRPCPALVGQASTSPWSWRRRALA